MKNKDDIKDDINNTDLKSFERMALANIVTFFVKDKWFRNIFSGVYGSCFFVTLFKKRVEFTKKLLEFIIKFYTDEGMENLITKEMKDALNRIKSDFNTEGSC